MYVQFWPINHVQFGFSTDAGMSRYTVRSDDMPSPRTIRQIRPDSCNVTRVPTYIYPDYSNYAYGKRSHVDILWPLLCVRSRRLLCFLLINTDDR